MARPVSPDKLKNIKLAVVNQISQRGYSITTVSNISKEAGVSDGYLYRFYDNKESLVQAVYEEEVTTLHNFIENSLTEFDSAKEVIEAVVHYFFEMTHKRPELYRFIHVMLHDPSFVFPKSRLEAIRKISVNLISKGRASGEFDPLWEGEDLFVLLFSVPFKFLDSRLRGTFKKQQLNESDKTRLVELLYRALSRR